MRLDVQVRSTVVGTLYRERDEYALRYVPEIRSADFVTLTMPVRNTDCHAKNIALYYTSLPTICQ